MNVIPGKDDSFAWSESLANHAGEDVPAGFEQDVLRIQTAGGLEAGHAALSVLFQGDIGTINRGLGWGLYQVKGEAQ